MGARFVAGFAASAIAPAVAGNGSAISAALSRYASQASNPDFASMLAQLMGAPAPQAAVVAAVQPPATNQGAQPATGQPSSAFEMIAAGAANHVLPGAATNASSTVLPAGVPSYAQELAQLEGVTPSNKTNGPSAFDLPRFQSAGVSANAEPGAMSTAAVPAQSSQSQTALPPWLQQILAAGQSGTESPAPAPGSSSHPGVPAYLQSAINGATAPAAGSSQAVPATILASGNPQSIAAMFGFRTSAPDTLLQATAKPADPGAPAASGRSITAMLGLRTQSAAPLNASASAPASSPVAAEVSNVLKSLGINPSVATVTSSTSMAMQPPAAVSPVAAEVSNLLNLGVNPSIATAAPALSTPTQPLQPSAPQAASQPGALAAPQPIGRAAALAQAAEQSVRQGGVAPAIEAKIVPPQVDTSAPQAKTSSNGTDSHNSDTPSGETAPASAAPQPSNQPAQSQGQPSPQQAAPQPAQIAAQVSTSNTPAAAAIAGAQSQAPAPTQPSAPLTPTSAGASPTFAVPDLNALAINIAAKSDSGARQFDIRLDPAELGRVEVRLSLDANGTAQAHLAADRPQTLALLQTNAPALTRALQDSGVQVASNGLQFSLRGEGRQDGDRPRSGDRGRTAALQSIRSATAVGSAAMSYVLSPSSEGVNILV